MAYSQHSGAVSEQIGSIPGAGGQLEHPTAGTINQESLAGERAAGMAGNYGSNAAMGTNAHGEGSAYGAEGSAGNMAGRQPIQPLWMRACTRQSGRGAVYTL